MVRSPTSIQDFSHIQSVKTYDISTRTLELDRPSPSTTSGTVADVDVEHVLETIKREEMEVGAWINVMGYVMDDRGRANAANTRASRREKDISNHVRVQAISVWSAGDVDVEAYEKAVRERQQVQS